MALKTINDLTTDTSPQSTDLVATWDGSASTSKKVTLANVIVGGGGAALSAANTFADTVTVTLPTNAAKTAIVISAFDNGAGIGGRLSIYENSNASTPAAGSINLRTKDGDSRYLWHDATGLLRTHTVSTTNATDTAGTVVGAQSSHADFKNVIGAPIADADALAALVTAADLVRRFTYKSGSFDGQEFSGVVLDGAELQRYGQDADAEHPAGKSLNIINAIGDMMLALREIERRLTAAGI